MIILNTVGSPSIDKDHGRIYMDINFGDIEMPNEWFHVFIFPLSRNYGQLLPMAAYWQVALDLEVIIE